MAKIGALGKVVFSVSKKTIKTFDEFKWDTGARWQTHDRHLKEPLLEFLGNDVETITFSMLLSRYLGVKPLTEIKKLHKFKKKGQILKLVIGGVSIGTYRWVITNVSTNAEHWHKDGTLMAAKINITIKSYAKR